MRWLMFFFVPLFVILLQPIYAVAQTETTISVAPAILDLAVSPGEKTQAILTIRNGGGFALPISVLPKSLINEDVIIDQAKVNASDASRWIEIAESDFLLEENETKKLLININVPTDASPGGHYAQLTVRGLSLEQTLDAGASIVVPEVAVTVLITVAGQTESAINIDAKGGFMSLFSTPSTSLMTSFYVSNEGNIHDLLTPNFVVEKNGKELYRQKLSSKILLPQTKKEFREVLQLPDGYGRYSAYLEIQYSNGQKTILTDRETLLVTPSLWSIFSVGVITFGSLYFYNHKANISDAWGVLTKRQT